MRSLPIAVLALGACHPVDTERVRVRGQGMVLEVVARADADQVHLRRFEIGVEPAAKTEVRCEGVGAEQDAHERAFASAPLTRGALFGLLAATEYDCTVTARRDGRALSAELSFETDALAEGVPDIAVERSGEIWGDYTLFNTWKTGDGGSDHLLLIADDRGRVRWSYRFDDETSVGMEARWLEGRSLLIGGGKLSPRRLGLDGEVAWKLPGLAGEDRFWHHEASMTASGTVLGLHAVTNHNANRSWEGFRIVEWDPVAGAERWSWSSQEAFDAGWLPLIPGDDPWHANALQQVSDGDGDGVMLSLPHLDRVLRIDRATGQISWALGRGLDFAMSDGDWFSGQHDPEFAGSRVLIHDNGTVGRSSRVVELELDVAQRKAEVVWQWSEPGWFEPLWGDADRLADGSVLVTRGHCGFCPTAGSGASSIAVVRPDGTVPWRLTLPDSAQGLYRSERIDGCDLFDRPSVCAER